MIKHIVAFRFRPEVTEPQVQSLLAELSQFPKQFSMMRQWSIGRNISTRDDKFTHAFVVEFKTEKELLEYLSSDEHENFVKERWRPIMEIYAVISYEYQGNLLKEESTEKGGY